MTKIREIILERNSIFEKTRQFFKERNVLEVDTAYLRANSVTDPYMTAYKVSNFNGVTNGYLQTSPEYAMKILLSKGSRDIFQLGKNFRAEENSPIHLSEFTLLEWYRIGYDHFKLMDETSEYIQLIVGEKKVEIDSYQEIFKHVLNINPFTISREEIETLAKEKLGDIPSDLLLDNYLSLLFSEMIEPTFNENVITFIHSYPASQASLAKTRQKDGLVTADRFEVYLGGMELANGFNELTNPKEQRSRFENDNKIRLQNSLNSIDIDEEFMQALEQGLPDCSGVALGLDRLLMIKNNANNISDVTL